MEYKVPLSLLPFRQLGPGKPSIKSTGCGGRGRHVIARVCDFENGGFDNVRNVEVQNGTPLLEIRF